jgi:hypothetical protein
VSAESRPVVVSHPLSISRPLVASTSASLLRPNGQSPLDAGPPGISSGRLLAAGAPPLPPSPPAVAVTWSGTNTVDGGGRSDPSHHDPAKAVSSQRGFYDNFLAAYGDAADPEPAAAAAADSSWYDDAAADPEPQPLPVYRNSQQAVVSSSALVTPSTRGFYSGGVAPKSQQPSAASYGGLYGDAADPEPASFSPATTIGRVGGGQHQVMVNCPICTQSSAYD